MLPCAFTLPPDDHRIRFYWRLSIVADVFSIDGNPRDYHFNEGLSFGKGAVGAWVDFHQSLC